MRRVRVWRSFSSRARRGLWEKLHQQPWQLQAGSASGHGGASRRICNKPFRERKPVWQGPLFREVSPVLEGCKTEGVTQRPRLARTGLGRRSGAAVARWPVTRGRAQPLQSSAVPGGQKVRLKPAERSRLDQETTPEEGPGSALMLFITILALRVTLPTPR